MALAADYLRMRFQKPAMFIPAQQSDEAGDGQQLQDYEPALHL
jgi:hypothetical protein